MARRPAWIAAVLASVLFVGCGESPTRAEYIAESDRICTREVSLTVNGKEAPFPLRGSPSFNRDHADDKQAALDELEDLEQLSDDRDVIDTWLAARQLQIDLLREGADAQEAGEVARVKVLTDKFRTARRVEFTAARIFGMKVCSRPAGTPAPG